ncbi:MAG: hypothetical protein M3Z32_00810, partial [Acidobacteriota bacterium]|nr:hypothetical protein [Acidobacteriota bacterium]
MQRRVPGSGAGLVAMEGPGKIPGDQGRQAATEGSESALPGAGEKPKPPEPEAVNEAARVITNRTFFSAIAAIGWAAMRHSRPSGEVAC